MLDHRFILETVDDFYFIEQPSATDNIPAVYPCLAAGYFSNGKLFYCYIPLEESEEGNRAWKINPDNLVAEISPIELTDEDDD